MSTKKAVTVSTTDDLRHALAAGYDADQISIAQPDNTAALEAARSGGFDQGKAEGAKAGATAERQRIADLHAIANEGFEKELQTAIDNGDAPEAFAMAQLKLAKDRGITLGAIRKDSPTSAAFAGAPSQEKQDTAAQDLLSAAIKNINTGG